jgi:thioredoxin reductase
MTTCDTLIVGAGPSGLSAAAELRRLGIEQVLVIDREKEPGGIPRHCHHTGFGVFDLKRVLSGPKYAAAHVTRARRAGAAIRTETTAMDWDDRSDAKVVRVTGPEGVQEVRARSVLLATGCRERPRTARNVPGARPGGIYTTSSLQRWVHVHHESPGTAAVVVGAEHVSYSAAMTLLEAGATVSAMVTEYPQSQTYGPAHWWVAGRNRIPLYTKTSISRILGRDRVSAVELQTGDQHRTVDCDTVVFTGDWIPDNETCRAVGIPLNARTRGPDVDQQLRTTVPGVFAGGNLLRGAETADVASLEGRHVARAMAAYLSADGDWPDDRDFVPLRCEDPIAWISPGLVTLGGGPAPRGLFTFRVTRFLETGRVVIRQDGGALLGKRFRCLVPNRWYTIPWGAWRQRIDGAVPLEVAFQ